MNTTGSLMTQWQTMTSFRDDEHSYHVLFFHLSISCLSPTELHKITQAVYSIKIYTYQQQVVHAEKTPLSQTILHHIVV